MSRQACVRVCVRQECMGTLDAKNYALWSAFLDWWWDPELAGELQGFCANRT